MLIQRKGIFKEVTKEKFQAVYKARGYEEVEEKPKDLTKKEKLQQKATELEIEFSEKTSVKELEKLIVEHEKAGD